jgi:hypothetical protein
VTNEAPWKSAFSQHAVDQGPEPVEQFVPHPSNRFGLLCLEPEELLLLRAAPKGCVARQAKVERRPKAVDVRPTIDVVGIDGLFRGHVLGSAQNDPALARSEDGFRIAREVGKAQVDDLHAAAAVHEDACRLDVAVDDAGVFMGVLQAQGRLAHVVGGAGDGHRSALLGDVLERGAIDVFHDQEVQLVDLVDVVGADDVRVVEGGEDTGLTVEALDSGRGLCEGSRQHLDGDTAPRRAVLAQVDARRSAGADPFEDLVLADGESPPFALQELLCLEEGRDAITDEPVGDLARVLQRDDVAGVQPCQVRGEEAVVYEAALLDEIEKLVGGARGRHDDNSEGVIELSAGEPDGDYWTTLLYRT